MKLLFVGDVVGRAGRQILARQLDRLVDRHAIDFVVVNGENAAGGFGLTLDVVREFRQLGVQVITSGNHIWDKKEFLPQLDRCNDVLRPANYPPGAPGHGFGLYETAAGIRVGVLNLEGRVFMSNLDCPFRCADACLEQMSGRADLILVDFHAEATSEKMALAHYLDGRVAALIGTHTHVPTADEQILPAGTAYQTDAGMTGSRDSVIGIAKDIAVERFVTQLPARFEVAKRQPVLCATLFDLDEDRGLARGIERIFCREEA
ncbi:MAG: TIGR00282 family metallophosphoesterase [Desulfuromonas thiophila]|jgi:metallophosphoesterase (TIGR00282 family)|nr:TIGR00282 family metallophosphoesterase [Desulfuromonas thiophila]